ncbi:MFS transporter [Siccirubricoccus sp. KC 17139]|uniref:MFS transporter n=1 Tax=Siccirubricoccus soli TaxID=2899147 RepID=A0ABT1D784_9PROT|nr:MFS transporter [Siccirubricoccus soli]MCO6417739.1 MFS transporter [Siccirubricoccus soli]MCP2683874.1 MFS transporter [Siccirubricoccus soli]
MPAPAVLSATPGFFGWRVVSAAFVVAMFGWGVSFYGPPIFLHTLQAERGWPVGLVSAAITCHFLVGAAIVANLAGLYRRFGLVAVTRAAALATALGCLGWALAAQPWQLFAATLLSGFGWAGTGGAAINAMVSPWFDRRRPAALSTAYNGASIGGVLLSPLWVLLIGRFGFAGAMTLVGGAMVLVLWCLAGPILGRSPEAMGQAPDGALPGTAAPRPAAPPPGGSLWRDGRFLTLAGATSLGLFAQIGLIAHLFSLLVPTLGAELAGVAAGLATACAILGRTALGWLLPPGADRRRAAAANYLLQCCGSLVLLAAGGVSVPLLLAGVVLFGLGLGNATSLLPLMAQQDFAPAEAGRVVALITACSQAAYAFAPAAFGLLREAGAPWGGPAGAPALFLAAALAQLLAAGVLLGGRRPQAVIQPPSRSA